MALIWWLITPCSILSRTKVSLLTNVLGRHEYDHKKPPAKITAHWYLASFRIQFITSRSWSRAYKLLFETKATQRKEKYASMEEFTGIRSSSARFSKTYRFSKMKLVQRWWSPGINPDLVAVECSHYLALRHVSTLLELDQYFRGSADHWECRGSGDAKEGFKVL